MKKTFFLAEKVFAGKNSFKIEEVFLWWTKIENARTLFERNVFGISQNPKSQSGSEGKEHGGRDALPAFASRDGGYDT